MTHGIFISYRRDEEPSFAGRLSDHLKTAFSPDRVFMDVDGIALGQDFVEVLNEQLQSCVALLAIIGPRWLTAVDKSGQRRIDNKNDFVRLEIETALKRGIFVLPVLMPDATVPPEQELPVTLKPLARRQAATIEHAKFARDTTTIIEALRRVFLKIDEETEDFTKQIFATTRNTDDIMKQILADSDKHAGKRKKIHEDLKGVFGTTPSLTLDYSKTGASEDAYSAWDEYIKASR